MWTRKKPPISRRVGKRAEEYLRKLHKRQCVKEQPWFYPKNIDDITV